MARMLKCVKCGKIKPIDDFGPNKTSSTGRQTYCRDCKNANYVKNMHSRLDFYIQHHFASRIAVNLGNFSPKDLYTRTEFYLGYKILHLIRKMDPEVQKHYGMNLKTAIHSYDFHIDHIKPLSSYKLIDGDQVNWELFREAWGINNLRAIPADENLRKGSKVESNERNTEDPQVFR